MASDSLSRVPLIPRDGTLTQQGAINWDNIAHRTVEFTVGALNRCANAGVDPYSLVVGQAVARNFPLARRGRDNVYNAVNSLGYQNGVANVLWFGVGVRALPRSLLLTDEGTSLLGLCATLGECFNEDFAAEVMFRIVKAYGAPSELTPSTAQWLAIIRACSGSFATSQFPLLAEGIMRLDPGSRRTTMLNQNMQHWPFIRGCPLPEDLANVVVEVGKIASGQLSSMYVSGCAAVGWIAAVAQWLFGLKVVVWSTPQDKDPAYTNCGIGEDAQIHMAFDNEPTTYYSRLVIVQKSYHLKDSTSIMIRQQDDSSSEMVLYSGRVPWNTSLTDTFGSDFHRLSKTMLNVGSAIGSAARIFKAIAKAEPGVPEEYFESCRGYSSASSGQGFISNALLWFSELEPFEATMNKSARLNFEQAKETYEEKFLTIQRLCNCGVCRDFEEMNELESEGYCLVLLMETIIVLCQITSGLVVVDQLHPMRSGLEAFYKRQESAHQKESDSEREDGTLEEALKTMGPIAYVLWTNGFVDLTLETYSQAMEGRLVAAIKLFTGRDTPTHLTASAVSESGIVTYLDILRDLSIDHESAGRVHVMPGRIEHDHKSYLQVQDNEIKLMRHTASVAELSSTIARLNEVIVEVTETAHALLISYVIRQQNDHNVYARIGPGDIVSEAHKARGLVFCNAPNRSCKRRRLGTIVCDQTDYPVLSLNYDGEEITIVDTAREREYLRAIALGTAARNHPTMLCILSDSECLGCCLTKIKDSEKRPAVIIKTLSNTDLEYLKA